MRRRSRQKSSMSPITSTPAARASPTVQCGAGWVSGTPGASTSAAIRASSTARRSAVGLRPASHGRCGRRCRPADHVGAAGEQRARAGEARGAEPEHGDLAARKGRDRDHGVSPPARAARGGEGGAARTERASCDSRKARSKRSSPPPRPRSLRSRGRPSPPTGGRVEAAVLRQRTHLPHLNFSVESPASVPRTIEMIRSGSRSAARSSRAARNGDAAAPS